MFSEGIKTASRWAKFRKCSENGTMRSYDDGACYIKHDTFVAPNDNNATVHITFRDISISQLDETEQTLKARLRLSMFWLESRIKANFSNPYNKGTPYDEIKFKLENYYNSAVTLRRQLRVWYPDFEFENRVKIKHASGNNMIREINILENNPFNDSMSFMEMKADFWLTVQCSFDFSNYPMDAQSCKFLLSSKDRHNVNFRLYKQEQVMPFDSLGFNMQIEFMDGRCGCNNYQAGFSITMDRILKPFIFMSYCPVIAIVLISAITFIIPVSSIPGRVGLAATLFLTLTNTFIINTVITHCRTFI